MFKNLKTYKKDIKGKYDEEIYLYFKPHINENEFLEMHRNIEYSHSWGESAKLSNDQVIRLAEYILKTHPNYPEHFTLLEEYNENKELTKIEFHKQNSTQVTLNIKNIGKGIGFGGHYHYDVLKQIADFAVEVYGLKSELIKPKKELLESLSRAKEILKLLKDFQKYKDTCKECRFSKTFYLRNIDTEPITICELPNDYDFSSWCEKLPCQK